jgi:DeoR/GlpR family transcriptional regulator of sugar metabolism
MIMLIFHTFSSWEKLMNTETRRTTILDRLAHGDILSYQELADLFNKSSMTIRRDVENLCRRGVAIKTLGGVRGTGPSATLAETPLASRIACQRAEKRAIARCAAGLLVPGQTIYLDGGTTCIELAKYMAAHRMDLTILSNSALVCMELGRGGHYKIIGIGGQYEPSNLCFVGPTAEDFSHRFFVDMAFFSTKGFLPEEGTFESFEPTYRIKQIVVGQCNQAVLLADHTKFGERSLCKVLDIEQIHTIVTDDGTPREHLLELERRNRRVWMATVPGRGSSPGKEGRDHAA